MQLTDRQRELVAVAAELGPAFEERAAKYDRDASFPHENFEDLRRVGFLALCIPEAHGGLGADLTTYALVSEEIGRHCGSTGLTFNMHTATMLLTSQIADDLELDADERALLERNRERLYRGVVEEGHIHAQPFSEGLSAGATHGIATTARLVDGGFRVSGRKIFASLSDAADLHNVICRVDGEDRIRFLGVPATAEGLRIEGEWDPVGMRGTVSKTLVMDDVFVPEGNEWLPPGAFDQAARRWPYFYLTLSFTYLGLIRGVLDLTAAYLRGEHGTGARRDHPVKQAGWAEMCLAHDRAQSLMYRVLEESGPDPSPEQLRRAWSAMVTTMETAPEVASLAMRVCGGRSLLRPLPLERYYRDARCGATMLPWSVELCLERLGRWGLYPDDGAPPA